MEGVGELFGRSVDQVLRRPRAALAPFAVDAAMLLLGTIIFVSAAGIEVQFPQGYRLPNLPVAVPHALPTVGDVMGPTPALGVDRAIATAALLLILVAVPILAFAEAGFLGVLKAVYLAPIDPLVEGRHSDAWSRIKEAFLASGKRHFAPFVVLRLIQAGLAVAALFLPALLPRFGNYGLGVLAVDVALLYAPYAVVETGRGPFAAIRESLQLVADFLATTLVALLFGFLLTGGISILVAPLVGVAGAYAPLIAAALYAPVGTALSLFLYQVYLSMRPREALAEPLPARDPVPAAG
ncbi:MAG TPA: hypothetical protein VHH36_09875 [Candidatus Thermoplasmatota archaeon]|nr:hypothetical protein [Candidatus Thermoplasmatota archaeon]